MDNKFQDIQRLMRADKEFANQQKFLRRKEGRLRRDVQCANTDQEKQEAKDMLHEFQDTQDQKRTDRFFPFRDEREQTSVETFKRSSPVTSVLNDEGDVVLMDAYTSRNHDPEQSTQVICNTIYDI